MSNIGGAINSDSAFPRKWGYSLELSKPTEMCVSSCYRMLV